MKQHDIFISYRRKTGSETALLIKSALQSKHYSVFVDVVNLPNGKFNEALYNRIEKAIDFIIILTPNSLDRCKNEEDWVRNEIRHALLKKRNIIPVFCQGFQTPEKNELPEDIKDFLDYHGVPTSTDLWEESMHKLAGLLNSKPKNRFIKPFFLSLISLAILSSLVFAFYMLLSPNTPFNMTVFVNEAHKIPGMPFSDGSVILQIRDKIEKRPITSDATFKQLPNELKGKIGRIVFEAKGYLKIDTSVVLNESAILSIGRDNSLGSIIGIVKDDNNIPLPGVSINVRDISVVTDSGGRFVIRIPYEKQLPEQRLTAYRKGYQLWEYTFPVIPGEEAKIILKNQKK